METVGIGYDEIISFRIGEKRFRIGGPYEISSWMMDARWCEGADIGYACLARLTRSAGSITRNQVYVSWYAYFQTVTYDLDEMQPSSLPLASLPFPSRVPPCVSRLQLAPSYLINVFLSFSPFPYRPAPFKSVPTRRDTHLHPRGKDPSYFQSKRFNFSETNDEHFSPFGQMNAFEEIL